jgi:hypothetical protein
VADRLTKVFFVLVPHQVLHLLPNQRFESQFLIVTILLVCQRHVGKLEREVRHFNGLGLEELNILILFLVEQVNKINKEENDDEVNEDHH